MFYTGYSVERAQYKRYKQQAISLKCIVHRSEQHCVVYGYKTTCNTECHVNEVHQQQCHICSIHK